jgi:hypothetical protein
MDRMWKRLALDPRLADPELQEYFALNLTEIAPPLTLGLNATNFHLRSRNSYVDMGVPPTVRRAHPLDYTREEREKQRSKRWVRRGITAFDYCGYHDRLDDRIVILQRTYNRTLRLYLKCKVESARLNNTVNYDKVITADAEIARTLANQEKAVSKVVGRAELTLQSYRLVNVHVASGEEEEVE